MTLRALYVIITSDRKMKNLKLIISVFGLMLLCVSQGFTFSGQYYDGSFVPGEGRIPDEAGVMIPYAPQDDRTSGVSYVIETYRTEFRDADFELLEKPVELVVISDADGNELLVFEPPEEGDEDIRIMGEEEIINKILGGVQNEVE